jgi:hypothetical protein
MVIKDVLQGQSAVPGEKNRGLWSWEKTEGAAIPLRAFFSASSASLFKFLMCIGGFEAVMVTWHAHFLTTAAANFPRLVVM